MKMIQIDVNSINKFVEIVMLNKQHIWGKFAVILNSLSFANVISILFEFTVRSKFIKNWTRTELNLN